jgi:hypothetical protein
MRQTLRRTLAAPATLTVALLAGGCDNGGGVTLPADPGPVAREADTLAITDLASAVVTGKSPGHICNVLLERTMVEEFYATVPACRRLVAARPDDTAAVAVVDAVDVDGARGTAMVTAQGGPTDGATGTWNFVRTPQGWRVEGWSVEYLRSIVLAMFGPRYQPTDAEDPLGSQPVRVCVNEQFQDKDDTEFLAAAKTYLRGGKQAEKLLAEAVAACSDDEKG